MINVILIGFYLAIFGVIRTKDSFVVSIAFLLSLAYAESAQWDADPAWLNHLYIVLCFAPCLLFTTKKTSITILIYMMYHWVVSGDYVFFAEETFIGNTFYIVAPALNLLIMLSLLYGRNDRVPAKTITVAGGWLFNILAYKVPHKSTQSRES